METKRKRSEPWIRPRGIYYKQAPNRPKPYLLGWHDGGQVTWQSFADEDAREEAAKGIVDKSATHGTEILNFDPREWRRWLEFLKQIGDADPFTVLQEWKATRAALGLPGGQAIVVSDAVKKYLAHRREESLSEDTHRHFEKHLEKRFAATHGALRLHDITAEVVKKWLSSLVHPRTGEAMDNVTKRHHRKDLNTFLAYCISEGWLAKNPCDSVPVPVVEEEDVQLLTIEEGRSLFANNKSQRVIGRIALEAFGFMRASTAGRIQKEQIQFVDRGIRMLGPEHKSRKTKFRQGHPDNLWAWLKHAPDSCWAMTAIQYRHEKHDAFVRAGIVGGSENRLRKTCLSAHLAWLKNQPLTSYLAQHRHTSTTEIYLGVMTEANGKAWFQILPK